MPQVETTRRAPLRAAEAPARVASVLDPAGEERPHRAGRLAPLAPATRAAVGSQSPTAGRQATGGPRTGPACRAEANSAPAQPRAKAEATGRDLPKTQGPHCRLGLTPPQPGGRSSATTVSDRVQQPPTRERVGCHSLTGRAPGKAKDGLGRSCGRYAQGEISSVRQRWSRRVGTARSHHLIRLLRRAAKGLLQPLIRTGEETNQHIEKVDVRAYLAVRDFFPQLTSFPLNAADSTLVDGTGEAGRDTLESECPAGPPGSRAAAQRRLGCGRPVTLLGYGRDLEGRLGIGLIRRRTCHT